MLKLGIIGMSEGNGHPYSWAAICNGYDQAAMARCPFPVIPDYLAEQSWPKARIGGAEVSHIWTQDKQISRQIAEASLIPTIVNDYTDMIGAVDAVLLARDDFQNHQTFAAPFLAAGLPVYIDKPLANSVAQAQALLSQQQYEGQIFTCSALRYMPRLVPVRARINDIVAIEAVTPKKWSTYGIHVIEPVLSLYDGVKCDKISFRRKAVEGERVSVSLEYEGTAIKFSSSGSAEGPLQYKFSFRDGSTEVLPYGDTFEAFKEALRVFLSSVEQKLPVIPRAETLAYMCVIEEGKGP